jgi:hypothetical protein
MKDTSICLILLLFDIFTTLLVSFGDGLDLLEEANHVTKEEY